MDVIEPLNNVLIAGVGLTKKFPGTVALDTVDFDVRKGEIHALLGANGAGKTTLMMLLSGVYRPDAGQILVDGREVRIEGPHHAQKLGIGTVFQELSLVPVLSVAENLLLGRLPGSLLDLVDRPKLRNLAAELLAQVGLDINPDVSVRDLSPAVRQLVEIAKALSLKPRVLLFDEPTSALSPREVERLFNIMQRLKTNGLGLVFITHRVREVFQIADRVTILRDGQKVGTFPTGSLSPERVVFVMAGHELQVETSNRQRPSGDSFLSVKGLTTGTLKKVTFEIRHGEILGIGGLPGSGREVLGPALFGLVRWEHGEARVDGKPFRPATPWDAIREGIGYLPPDRKEAGLFLRLSIRDNIVVTRLSDVSRFGMVQWPVATSVADQFMRLLGIRAASVLQPVGLLSGGTQQKVLVARWLAVKPRLLIAEDPTVGIDVATRSEIHNLLRRLASGGSSVLLISSDLSELVDLSDRVLVFADGRIVAERDTAATSEEEVLALASGATASG